MLLNERNLNIRGGVISKIKCRIKATIRCLLHGIPSVPNSDTRAVQYGYLNEVNHRSVLLPSDIHDLSKDIDFSKFASIGLSSIEPNYYGAYYTLQRYAELGVDNNISPKGLNIQHGILYEARSDVKSERNLVKLVWSQHAKKMHDENSHNYLNIPIGAPFFYSRSLYNDEFIKEEKKRLGRNLLAFPMHSTHFINTEYDSSKFIEVLKKERERFDSVRVCLYWKDILRGGHKEYVDAGVECVCCGHIFDLMFLSRQRSLFEIADATISNRVGSHIGYSLFLNKPHRLVPDDFELVDIKYSEGQEEQKIMEESVNYNDINDVFMMDDYKITERQREVVDRLWGVSDIKSPKEIREILMNVV